MAIEWEKRGCDAKVGTWITAEDKKYKVEKMTDEHLYKAIEYIRLYGGVLRQFELDKIDELVYEIERRFKEDMKNGRN